MVRVGVSNRIMVSCRSGVSTALWTSLISCVLNADSGRYADALISHIPI